MKIKTIGSAFLAAGGFFVILPQQKKSKRQMRQKSKTAT